MVKASLDQKDLDAHQEVTIQGGLKGGALGLSSSLIASVIAAKSNKLPSYSKLPLNLKAFSIVAVTTASFIISADMASRNYELAKYAIGSGSLLEREARRDARLEVETGISKPREQGSLKGLSTKDAIIEYSKSHRYGIVFGGWATSMVGSFAYIAATPLSFAQKLVQARMVAQALTVAVLITSAGLSSIPTAANNGQNDEEVKRSHREDLNLRWKRDSPHALAMAELERKEKEREGEKFA